MSQHDYVIANQSGAAFRADLNNALAAIVSQNSGAAEPSTTYAYMPWADTSNGLFKIRNAANSDWITLYQLDGEWDTIALEDGTALAPSLYFKDSGTDTGIYSPAADNFAITTAGVERVNFKGATEVVFNDGGADIDFRIEGDTEPNLFKIDAGTDQVQVANLNGGPLAGARNRIINGDMRIAQRGTGAVTASGSYPVDRWTQGFATSGAVSAQYETASTPTGFQAAIKFTTTTADATTNSTDQWDVQQIIEGFNSADLLFGTANAQDVTVSFWVRSSVTGTFCMTLLGSSDGTTVDRSYVSEYTISSADTWEYKTITVPGDTGGTWTTNNGRGLIVRFGLTAGTSVQQAAGSWGTGNVAGSSNQTQLLETLNATWYLTGVQLEAGTVATPFERRSYGQELALCQRYYEVGRLYGSCYYQLSTVNASDRFETTYCFKQTKRAAPTITTTNSGTGTISTVVTTEEATGIRRVGNFDSALNVSLTASAEL